MKVLNKNWLEEARKKILEVLYPLHIQKTAAEHAADEITRFLSKFEDSEPKAKKKSSR